MASGSLNCPNCGAGVAIDSTVCQFCQTRLKTMACPTCFQQMFVGLEFCDHCGARAVQSSVAETADLGDCPRCRQRLGSLRIGDTDLAQCTKCDGLWSDVATFERICGDREQQSAVLGFAGSRHPNAESLSSISYVPCPVCKQLMNRSNFAHASGVIIDTCKQHGVWFDADELPRVVKFVQKGGMEIARQHEKLDLDEQRQRLRDEQRKLAEENRRFDMGSAFGRNDEGLKGFLNKLFD